MPHEHHQELPIIELDGTAAWSAWLQEHHGSSAGIWLRLAKRGAPRKTPSYAEAVELALCFGWIDGQKDAYDQSFWLQRFTPRGPRSRWSQRNREKATELIRRGAMRPAGLAEVQRAKRDGRWDAAYEPQSTAAVPEDLREALALDPQARAFFETLSGANRYAILYRIAEAKRVQTRADRITKFVAMLHDGRTLH
jgi:uncharacterized protein YdeI (YjbR/CyaY-like superfamily)